MGYRWKTFPKINAATPIFFNNQMFISSEHNEGCTLLNVSGAQPTLGARRTLGIVARIHSN